jgi:hypothetical protein
VLTECSIDVERVEPAPKSDSAAKQEPAGS